MERNTHQKLKRTNGNYAVAILGTSQTLALAHTLHTHVHTFPRAIACPRASAAGTPQALHGTAERTSDTPDAAV
eukprot:1616068-Amphidinium_carterae.1